MKLKIKQKPPLLFLFLMLTLACQKKSVDTSQVVNRDALFHPGLGWMHLEENESIGPFTRIHNKIFCGEIGCGDHQMEMVDIASFEVWPGTEYARDKYRVFFPEEMICVTGYNCSACFNDNPILEGADPTSFRCLEAEIGEDKNGTYRRGQRSPK